MISINPTTPLPYFLIVTIIAIHKFNRKSTIKLDLMLHSNR